MTSRRGRINKLRWRVGLEIIQDYARELGVTLREQEYPMTRLVVGGSPTGWRPPQRRVFLWEIDFSGRGRGWVRNDFISSSAGELAYNHVRREVVWVSSKESTDLVTGMLHEVTHARWGHCRDAGDEWYCGMIPWELAWIQRLVEPRRAGASATTTRILDLLSAEWRSYASTGGPTYANLLAHVEARARKAVRVRGLPDPWAPSDKP